MVQAGYSYARKWEEEAYVLSSPVVNYQTEVKRTDNKVKIGRAFVVKTSLFLFAYALLLVYLCIKSSTLGYQIVKLEDNIASLDTANHSLEYSIAQQTSLDRIEVIATRDLGMHQSAVASAVCMNVPDTMQVAAKPAPAQTAQAEKGTLNSIYDNLRHLANND